MPPNDDGIRSLYQELALINRSLGNLEAAGADRLRTQEQLARSMAEILNRMALVKNELAQHRQGVHNAMDKLHVELNRLSPEISKLTAATDAADARIAALEAKEAERERQRQFTRRQLLVAKAVGSTVWGAAIAGAFEIFWSIMRKRFGFD